MRKSWIITASIIIYILLSYMLAGTSRNLSGEIYDVFLYIVTGPMSFVLPIQDISGPQYLGLVISYVVMTLIVGGVIWFLLGKGIKTFLLLRSIIVLCVWCGVGLLGFLFHSVAT